MKKNILILIILFSILAIDLPLMLAYESSLVTLHLADSEQTNTINYLQNKEPLSVDYTKDETSHLNDVQKLMHFANNYFIFVLVIEIFLLIAIYQIDKKQFYKPFLYGGIVSTAVLLLILLLTLIDFSSLFTLFHQIFFPQGNWMFPETGKLVNLFPAAFFYQITKEIFIKSLMSSIIFIGLGLYLREKW